MQIHPSDVNNYKKIKAGVEDFIIKNKAIILSCILIFFYLSLYFFIDFSTQSLIAHDEGLYARRARLVESSENWFYPPFDSPHHKTLGSYWLIALSLKLFGNTELAARLPSILSSFLCLISSYLIALKITNKKSALISLFSLCSMPIWVQSSRYASPDFPFLLCILLVILFFLNFLDSSKYISKYFYIFFSGIFLSSSFFIRSYMAFVPLLGLIPFFSYHLYNIKNNFKLFFFSGILIGFIPTVLNLYFSFQKFGVIGITSLFDFALSQAVGEIDLNNLLLIPLKFIILTFPVGLLLVILLIFTRANLKVDYPLLTYCYPLISLFLLLCMSTSYSHYYLFLLPSLSIVFSTYLTSNSFRYDFSRLTISYILTFTLLSISSILLLSIIIYKDFLSNYYNGKLLIIYISSFILLFSYFRSIKFLFDIKSFCFNLIRFFYNIIIYQYISISVLFNFGLLGNPNYKTKQFLKDEDVSSIINSNTIYLFSVETKTKTLLSYYLPSSKVIKDPSEINKYKYIITSKIGILEELDVRKFFISVNKFDNHVLLMNISN